MKKETFEKAKQTQEKIDGSLRALTMISEKTKGCGDEEILAVYINNDPIVIELRAVLTDHLNKKIKTLQKQFDNLK